MSLSHCPMCQYPIPLEKQDFARVCDSCGADLTRWTRSSSPTVSSATPPPIPTGRAAHTTHAGGAARMKKVALFSFISPWLALGLVLVSMLLPHAARAGGIILSVVVILGGLVAGVIALLGCRKYGRTGIFGWALAAVCLILPGLLLVSAAIVVPLVRGKPETPQEAAARYFAEQHYTTPTPDEAAEFGRLLEARVAQGDVDFYAHAYDVDYLIHAVFNHTLRGSVVTGQSSFRDQFAEGLRRGLTDLKAIKLLRVKSDGGNVRLLIRFTTKVQDKMTDYQELTVMRNSAGQLKIVNNYDYVMGATTTDSMRQLDQAQIEGVYQSFFTRILHPERFENSANDWTTFTKMKEQLAAGNASAALQSYRQLSSPFQSQKSVQLLRMMAALQVNEKEYQEAARSFNQQYPNDSAYIFTSLNHDDQLKDFDAMLVDVDKLDKLVGGDAYLDQLRAEACMSMVPPRMADSEKYLRRAMEQEPTLYTVGFLLVGILNQDRKYDECVTVLEKMHAQGSLTRQQLNRGLQKIPEVQVGLVSSRIYQNWLSFGEGKAFSSFAALNLQSIYYQGENSSATINGQVVKVGSKIGDWQVVRISALVVTVKSSTGEQRLLTK